VVVALVSVVIVMGYSKNRIHAINKKIAYYSERNSRDQQASLNTLENKIDDAKEDVSEELTSARKKVKKHIKKQIKKI
jgi:transposase